MTQIVTQMWTYLITLRTADSITGWNVKPYIKIHALLRISKNNLKNYEYLFYP